MANEAEELVRAAAAIRDVIQLLGRGIPFFFYEPVSKEQV
jgi:hypothetical protein